MEQRTVTVEQHVLNKNPSENVKDVKKQGTCWIESILLFLKEDIGIRCFLNFMKVIMIEKKIIISYFLLGIYL